MRKNVDVTKLKNGDTVYSPTGCAYKFIGLAGSSYLLLQNHDSFSKHPQLIFLGERGIMLGFSNFYGSMPSVMYHEPFTIHFIEPNPTAYMVHVNRPQADIYHFCETFIEAKRVFESHDEFDAPVAIYKKLSGPEMGTFEDNKNKFVYFVNFKGQWIECSTKDEAAKYIDPQQREIYKAEKITF